METSSFGPSALATPANAVTIARLVLAPLLCLLILEIGPSYGVLALWIVLASTDGLDGWLAKRFNWTSHLGKILDPLADKLLLVALFLTAAGAFIAAIPFSITRVQAVAPTCARSPASRSCGGASAPKSPCRDSLTASC